ncbi:MAG TPA: LuxR C-terminal-related transcriptional regulator [Chloroflexota bacterium]
MAIAFSFPQAQPTPLLGRVVELETIVQRLTQEQVRLLSLTGPGGVGKTRLALEARDRLAGQFPDGVTVVDLAPIRDADLVLPTIAHALGILDWGTRPLPERLEEYLSDRELLLILDTFEQVLPAAEQLPKLLSAAPGLRMLVTSRVPLRLRWEQSLRIFPLEVPALDSSLPIDELVQVPSIALFVDRARAQHADFVPTEQEAPLLIHLTRQLDGLPLALELAAGQMNVLPLAVIASHLEQRVHTLHWDAHDLPDRQRSLQTVIGWSYELLTETEQRLFRHLGVFVGRVSLNAIDTVTGNADADRTLEGIAALAEKSLVLPGQLRDGEPEPAFELLDTIRHYACEQLDARGELEAAGQAHAQYFLSLAEQADPQLMWRGQVGWCRRLEAEHDNLRVALRWLLDHNSPESALSMAGALGRFWWLQGYHSEGLHWLEEALREAPDAPPTMRTKALLGAGLLLFWIGDFARSKSVLEEALAIAQKGDDRVGIAQALTYLGAGATTVKAWTESRRWFQEALPRTEELHDDYQMGLTLGYFAYLPFMQGNYQESASLFSASRSRLQAIGELVDTIIVQFYLAVALHKLGDVGRATRLVQEGLERSRDLQDRWLLSLGVEATLSLVVDRADAARRARLLGAGDTLVQATGAMYGTFTRAPGQNMAVHRAQLEQEGLGVAYRQGRSMPFGEVVTLAQELLEEFAVTLKHPEKAVSEPRTPQHLLSPREHEVLRLVAEGLTSKQIGQQLFLSHRTVDHHVTSIFNKLGVDTRAQAVAVATRDGLLWPAQALSDTLKIGADQ